MTAIVVKMMDMPLLEFVYDLALPSILLYVPLYFLKWKDCLDILHGYFWIVHRDFPFALSSVEIQHYCSSQPCQELEANTHVEGADIRPIYTVDIQLKRGPNHQKLFKRSCKGEIY